MKSVLFVCLGNICRSPLADGVANKMAREKNLDLHIDSAGTSNWHRGENPCQNSIIVGKKYNVDISALKSRPIIKKDIEEFDFIVAMDEQNFRDLHNFGFKDIYKLGDFGGYEGACVPAPYHYSGFEGFEVVFKMIDRCVKDFLTQVESGKLEKKS